MSARPENRFYEATKMTTCKTCHAENLAWAKTAEGRWILCHATYDGRPGQRPTVVADKARVHRCGEDRSEMAQIRKDSDEFNERHPYLGGDGPEKRLEIRNRYRPLLRVAATEAEYDEIEDRMRAEIEALYR